jgi:CheY-like chemotaxis protein
MQPDLVALDLLMPEVNGLDVLPELQSDPATGGIPILVMTAKQVQDLEGQVLNVDPDQPFASSRNQASAAPISWPRAAVPLRGARRSIRWAGC